MKSSRAKRQSGFSMIEVLVAATILIIIVMMMSSMFQQASVMWRIGQTRTQGYTALRAYVGAIQRLVTQAIDAKDFPEELLRSGTKQSFASGRLQFYTEVPSRQQDERTLNFIDLRSDGSWERYTLQSNGGWQKTGEAPSLNDLTITDSSRNEASPISGFRITWPRGTETYKDGRTVANENRLPMFVTISAEVTQQGALYQVGAESAGPDRKWDTEDDIRTWAR